jgi:hypothetical protein
MQSAHVAIGGHQVGCGVQLVEIGQKNCLGWRVSHGGALLQ